VFHGDPGFYIDGFGYAADLGGAVEVVEEGGHAVKPHSTKELFVMEASPGFFEDGVPLLGDGAEFMVDGHAFFLQK